MAEAVSELDCPVCGEYFDDPKLLACNHVTCGKCIVDWLKKAGPAGGCPLCRAPILSTPPSLQDDLETQVNALPTDLAIVAKVESTKLLNSLHECMSCDNSVAASSFCLQCNMKLCKTCAKTHKKFPALKNHVVDELDNLTAERLAEINRVACKIHDDRLAELHCTTHQELICMLCATTSHRACTDVKAIKEAAAQKREKFRLEAQTLREKEKAMRTQIKKCKDAFADIHTKADKVFDNLQQRLERRRQEIHALVHGEEEKMALKQWDQVRAAITSQAGVLDNLVTSAPDDALLDMEKSMMSRLQGLEEQTGKSPRIQEPVEVPFDDQALIQLESAVSTLGQRGQSSSPSSSPTSTAALSPRPASTPSTTTSSSTPVSHSQQTTMTTSTLSSRPSSTLSTSSPTSTTTLSPSTSSPGSTILSAAKSTTGFVVKRPTGAKLASILKVGDRVRLNPFSNVWPLELRFQKGTVIAKPSKFRRAEGREPWGCVDVRWDGGQEDWYDMGGDGSYDLELV